MFTEGDRDRLLEELIEWTHTDDAVTAAALVGSAAAGATDRWSDIDLALRLADDADLVGVADHWTRALAEDSTLSDFLDVWAGPALYRVFLLQNSLQVDLSFWPSESFASTGEPFAQLFGEPAPTSEAGPADRRVDIGWGWLYALHTRSAIVRGRNWQALQMLEGLRDRVIALACLRHDLPAQQGRGVDQLPKSLLAALTAAVPVEVSSDALAASFTVAVDLLATEADHVDPALASRLRDPLATLQSTATPAGPSSAP